MPIASQLGIYQGALRILAERKLASIAEDRKPRRLLDDVYADGGREFCLEQGEWNFATKIDLFNGVVVPPTFGQGPAPASPQVVGFRFSFPKPADWVRTCSVSTDPYFRAPLTALQVQDLAGTWTCDNQQLYIKYVSSTYGLDFSRWGMSFYRYVQAYFAQQTGYELSKDKEDRQYFDKRVMAELINARSKDALQEGEMFPPLGTWAGSRSGRATRRDRGSISSLYG